MAYSAKIKEKARIMRLNGKTFEDIAKEKEMPSCIQTLWAWSMKGKWKEINAQIAKSAQEKTNEKLVDEFEKINQLHIAQLREAHLKIRNQWQRDDLTPTEIRALTMSLDAVIKNERLITGLATNKEEVTGEIIVKGYKKISPDDWDDLNE